LNKSDIISPQELFKINFNNNYYDNVYLNKVNTLKINTYGKCIDKNMLYSNLNYYYLFNEKKFTNIFNKDDLVSDYDNLQLKKKNYIFLNNQNKLLDKFNNSDKLFNLNLKFQKTKVIKNNKFFKNLFSLDSNNLNALHYIDN